MMFFVLCAAAIAFISSRCWYLDRMRRQTAKPDEFGQAARELIEAATSSRDETEWRMQQFYKDHPRA